MDYSDEIFDITWIKKYEPQQVKDLVLTDDVKTKIEEYLEKEEIPSLLLCSKPGQGKTTLAKILCKEIGATVLFINASMDNSIDTIRGRINSFVQTMSLNGSLKVVILDEADRLSPSAQDALRGMIEDNVEHTRFILTANEGARITDALRSRCTLLNVVPGTKKEFILHIFKILNKECVKVSDEAKTAAIGFLSNLYPDMRKAINETQKHVVRGELQVIDKTVTETFIDNLYNEILKGNPLEVRKMWIKNEHDFQGDYQFLLKKFFQYIYSASDISQQKRAEKLIMIADGLRDSVFVLDQEINFYSVILKIMTNE